MWTLQIIILKKCIKYIYINYFLTLYQVKKRVYNINIIKLEYMTLRVYWASCKVQLINFTVTTP
jgi:hypothetical protein